MIVRVGVVLTVEYLSSRTACQQNRLGSILMQFLDGVRLLSDLPGGGRCARLFRRPFIRKAFVFASVCAAWASLYQCDLMLLLARFGLCLDTKELPDPNKNDVGTRV